jgi:hypothetical protein
MAAPALGTDQFRGNKVRVIAFTQSGANNGDLAAIEPGRALSSMSFQLTGTYVAGTVKAQCSNDGSTWADTPTAASLSGLGVKSIAVADLGYRYYRLDFASMDAGNTLAGNVVMKFY